MPSHLLDQQSPHSKFCSIKRMIIFILVIDFLCLINAQLKLNKNQLKFSSQTLYLARNYLFLESMEIMLNKKNINRIYRKNVAIIQPSSLEKHPFSTISTFRSIKQTKKLLQESRINKPSPIKIENILTSSRYLSQRRKYFSLLSKPKVNFKEENCQRNTAHDNFYEFAREKLVQKNRNNQMMNRTISFAVSRQQLRIKSLYEQHPIDLQRDEFKRRHESLRKYQQNSGSEFNEISRNIILSNDLGKLTTNEIIKIKQRQQMQKEFLMGLTKFGQALSNGGAQSEQMRENLTALPSGKSIDENQRKKRFQEQMVGLHEGLERPAIEKYRQLLSTIQDTQLKFPTQNYEDYDKALLSKHGSGRTRKRASKVLLSCAEEWR